MSRFANAYATRVVDDMGDTKRSDLGRARELVSQAQALSPRAPLTHFVEANRLRAEGQGDDAILEYEAGLAVSRYWVGAISSKGGARHLGRIDQAIRIQERTARLGPSDFCILATSIIGSKRDYCSPITMRLSLGWKGPESPILEWPCSRPSRRRLHSERQRGTSDRRASRGRGRGNLGAWQPIEPSCATTSATRPMSLLLMNVATSPGFAKQGYPRDYPDSERREGLILEHRCPSPGSGARDRPFYLSRLDRLLI